jgi:hypothetical protein
MVDERKPPFSLFSFHANPTISYQSLGFNPFPTRFSLLFLPSLSFSFSLSRFVCS